MELVRISMMLEKYFKNPQDIEFAYDQQNNLVILQTRRLQIEKKRIEMKCNLSELGSFKKITVWTRDIVREGIAIGRVYKVTSSEDLDNVPDECILVATSSSPILAKVIKKGKWDYNRYWFPHWTPCHNCQRIQGPYDNKYQDCHQSLKKNNQEITLNATENVVYEGFIKELCYYEFVEEKFEEIKEYRLLKRIYKKNFSPESSRPYRRQF